MLFGVEAGEQAAEVFGIFVVFINNRRRVGERQDVVAEPAVVLKNVVDQAAQESDV